MQQAGYRSYGFEELEVGIAMDVAASEFFSADKGIYKVDGKELSSSELVAWTRQLPSLAVAIAYRDFQ